MRAWGRDLLLLPLLPLEDKALPLPLPLLLLLLLPEQDRSDADPALSLRGLAAGVA
jgi:hypothetical protein